MRTLLPLLLVGMAACGKKAPEAAASATASADATAAAALEEEAAALWAERSDEAKLTESRGRHGSVGGGAGGKRSRPMPRTVRRTCGSRAAGTSGATATRPKRR
jgi:hypothetical protein